MVVYGFWSFSFQRNNGLLESFPTNNKEVEGWLMRGFVTMSALLRALRHQGLIMQQKTNLAVGHVEMTDFLTWMRAMFKTLGTLTQ